MSALAKLISKDNEIIPYRKELNAITGGVTATILLQQIIYWYSNNGNKPFYKFIEPCQHEKYTAGDSWCEELGFSRKELLTAMKKLEDLSIVSKKTNMNRVTFYTLNLGDLDKALKGIYVNAERGFTKMPKGDLDNKETEITTENTQKEKINKKDFDLAEIENELSEKFASDLVEIENELSEKFASDLVEMKYPLDVDKYQDFIQHRKEMKKPITEIAAKQHIQLLCKYPRDIQAEIIKQSISSGWSGLFEPKMQKQFTQPTNKRENFNNLVNEVFADLEQQGETVFDVEVVQ